MCDGSFVMEKKCKCDLKVRWSVSDRKQFSECSPTRLYCTIRSFEESETCWRRALLISSTHNLLIPTQKWVSLTRKLSVWGVDLSKQQKARLLIFPPQESSAFVSMNVNQSSRNDFLHRAVNEIRIKLTLALPESRERTKIPNIATSATNKN